MSSVGLSPETLARLEAQLQADLDAVRPVRTLLTPTKDAVQGSPATQPPVVPPAAAEEKGAVTPAGAIPTPAAPTPAPFVPPPGAGVAVPQAVALIDGEFGLVAVKRVLTREHLGGHAETEIRKVLNKMVKSGELRVVTAPRGRGGSTYQRVTQG